MLNNWNAKKKENNKIQIPENHSCREDPSNPVKWKQKKNEMKKIQKLKIYKDKSATAHLTFLLSR